MQGRGEQFGHAFFAGGGLSGAQLDGDAIVAKLKTQLANFKIPKRCFVATELPRNTMGKVQKNLLREQYKGLFA